MREPVFEIGGGRDEKGGGLLVFDGEAVMDPGTSREKGGEGAEVEGAEGGEDGGGGGGGAAGA